MSASTPVLERSGVPEEPTPPTGSKRLARSRKPRTPMQAPSEGRVVASYVLTTVSICLAVLLLNLVVISQLQHYISQRSLYGEFRQGLAEGSLPTGQTTVDGDLTPLGTPLARIQIPAIDVDEIVVEGSTSYETMKGIGHRRDTPLPGQPGVSVLLGRAAAYGGVFSQLDQLKSGDTISVLTQQGTATYSVIGVRVDGAQLPVLGASDGRMTLATASGPAYRPNGVVRVDATLTSEAVGRPAPVLSATSIPDSEQALAGDRSHSFALTWLLLLLGLVLVAGVWSWKRWSRPATWLVFTPLVMAIGLGASSAIAGMLPNLL